MSWPVATVGEVCEVVSGATPRTGKPEFWDGNVPWVTPKDLSELGQKHLSDTPRKITKAGLKSCSARMLPAQSVLFSSRAPIGLVAINTIPVCTNQGFKSLVPRFDLVSPDFLFWWLRAQEKHVQSKGRGATFKEVSKKIVEDLQIPLPPLDEQKRIAGILDAADALRAKRREALAQLDTLLQSTFLAMFGDPVTNPMGWDAPPLADFCKTGTGGTPSRGKMQRYYEGGTIPWVKSGELREEVITSTGEHITEAALRETSVKLVPKDALLLALYGATVGRLGILGIRATTNQAVCHIIPNSLRADFRYMFHSLSNQVSYLVGRGVGGAQPNISQGIIKSLAIPLPPLNLQHRYATIVKSIEQQKASQRTHLAELDTLFASLQSRAFRGDL